MLPPRRNVATYPSELLPGDLNQLGASALQNDVTAWEAGILPLNYARTLTMSYYGGLREPVKSRWVQENRCKSR